MADFKIKSAAGTGNKTLIQGQDQSGSDYAIEIGDAGALKLGTITSGIFPAGHVIQVVNNTYTTGSNSSSFGDTIAKVEISSATNYKGTINNVGASNHVWVICSFQLRLESSSHNPGGEVVITRDTTNLCSGTDYDQYNYHRRTSTQTNVGTENTVL